jgi:hypothetical protein
MREGMDLTQVWVREPKEIPCYSKHNFYRGTTGKDDMEWPFPEVNGCVVIGFCGKIYPLIRIIEEGYYEDSDYIIPMTFCYSYEEWKEYCSKKQKKKTTREQYLHKRYSSSYERNHVRDFFEECEKNKNSYEHLFIEHNTPIFVASWKTDYAKYNKVITFNSSFEDTGFIRIFDPYQAYQEIQMYFGSVLHGSDGHKSKYKGQMIEPELDDKTKAEAHGFDRFSFRNDKHPSKPRKNRKKNRKNG